MGRNSQVFKISSTVASMHTSFPTIVVVCITSKVKTELWNEAYNQKAMYLLQSKQVMNL